MSASASKSPQQTAAAPKVSLPLAAVIKNLPDRLKATIASVPSADASVDFPPEQLLPQVAKGSVKVKFSELIEAGPPNTFMPLPGSEDELIELPLGEVIARMGAGMFARKEAKQAPSLEPQNFFGANRKAEPAVPTSPPASPPPAAAPTFAPSFKPTARPLTPKTDPITTPPTFAPAISPKPAPAKPTPAPEPAKAPVVDGKAAIALNSIYQGLPAELKSVVPVEPPVDAFAQLPIALLMPQLAKGKITVSLSELAAASPPGIFNLIAGNEQTPIPLPLADVLAQIGPGAFKRKAPAKTFESVGDQNFFGGQSNNAPAAAVPPVEPVAEPPPAAPGFAPSAPTPSFAPAFTPVTPAEPMPSTVQSEPPAAPVHKFEPAELSQPTAAAPPESQVPASDEPAASEVLIPMGKLDALWPEELKAELSHLAEGSVVVFPAEELGHLLKTGKIRFTWAQIRSWLQPKTNFGGTNWENTHLEIPLKAVVGPFMAAMRGKPMPVAKPQATESSSSPQGAQPDSFNKPSSKPTPYVAPSFAPAGATAPANPTMPMDGPVGMPANPKPIQSQVTMPAPAAPATPSQLGKLLKQPGKDHWTPIEIVQGVSAFGEISGAMISLAEGQIAASQLSEGINAELLAFRIPKLFGNTADQVRELLDKPMSYFSFSADGVPWMFFKLGNIFFTVEGAAGESLPVSRLQSIAIEIGRQRR